MASSTHSLLISLVTNALRQLVGIKIRICYLRRSRSCHAQHYAELKLTWGNLGLLWKSRKMLISVNNQKAGSDGRRSEEISHSPEATRARNGEQMGKKQLGLWETGPRGIPVVPLTASPWPGSGFDGVGTISLLIIFLRQTMVTARKVRGVISRGSTLLAVWVKNTDS